MEIRIEPMTEAHVESFHRCLDAVARERRWLALPAAPPLDAFRGFVLGVMASGAPQLVAVAGDGEVVGWCDVMGRDMDGFRHAGSLGMGLLPEWRGRGIGTRLANAAIDAARARGIERVELEVFASNGPAIALYERLGFALEGTKRRARKLDGEYDDIVLMAIFPTENS